MAELLVRNLSVSAGAIPLVTGASLAVRSGELVVVIGENGSGKSSLLRGIIGFLPASGERLAGGRVIAALSASARGRALAWLPQAVPIAWPIRVGDVVALGRWAFGAAPDRPSARDQAAVSRAMAACGVAGLSQRLTTTLSGGELARVHLARALASEAPLLLADEPTAALDPRHRLEIMAMLRREADNGRAILLVLHDLDLAARFADRIIAMKRGAIIADGTPDDVMTAEILAAVFGVTARIDHANGWPQPVIIGSVDRTDRDPPR